MRILAVTPYYAPEGGGLERYAHSILGGLARRGHDVQALAFTRGPPATVEAEGVHVRRAPAAFFLGNSPIHLGFAKHVASCIRTMRPDIVVAHTPVPFPAEMAYRAARREGVPFVLTYHAGRLRGGSRLRDGLARIHRATVERSMIRGATRLIATTPYVRDHALARARCRVALVPPGVDTAQFSPAGPAPALGILFAAPLAAAYRWKGVDVLWRAFAAVRAAVPEATLTLVGAGDRLGEFHAGAALQPGVRVLGRISEAQLVEEYRRASVVAAPSTTDAESFGMVLAEANACGRPVVGSAIGGIPDFVRHGDNGLLARPGDAKDLAARLVQVLRDAPAALAMGERGRQRVLREHAWGELCRRTEHAYEQAVGP